MNRAGELHENSESEEHDLDTLQFDPSFLFGVATAAYQIEGAVLEDGRGASIWDVFSHTPGRVRNGDTGDVACDHYHRWEKDLDLIASLHANAYRFSIAWPRLYPSGGRTLNAKGLAFYDRLIDGCLQRNIKVFPTLYHWDLPQALADKGGWSNRGTADAFAEYAATVMDHFGDRIDAISTFNEPWCSAILGHLEGIHAPGEKNLDAALAVVHGQHRAHGLAIQAMRASRDSVPLGIVLNPQSVYPSTEEDVEVAARHEIFNNGLFFEPLFKGSYPADIVKYLGDRLPAHWYDDMSTIHQKLDFWGLNYYTPMYVSSSLAKDAAYPASRHVPRQNVPQTDFGWEIDASTMTDVLIKLNGDYALPPCYITENGAAFNHEARDGRVADQPRISYLRSHLGATRAAINAGVDIRGYFAWSLLDNFEWAEGYQMRFGLVHVDYATQTRTLKDSAIWYRQLIEDQHSYS